MFWWWWCSFGRRRIGRSGWGFLPSPSRVGSLLLADNTMTAMLHDAVETSKKPKQSNRKLVASRDGKISIIQLNSGHSVWWSSVERQIFGRKTTRKEIINLLANSLKKSVGKIALKTWHFKDIPVLWNPANLAGFHLSLYPLNQILPIWQDLDSYWFLHWFKNYWRQENMHNWWQRNFLSAIIRRYQEKIFVLSPFVRSFLILKRII